MTLGRWTVVASVVVLAIGSPGTRAVAETFDVPDAIRNMRDTHEEVHVLRALADGAALGEQRFHASVQNDRLILDVATHFTSGEEWDERAEMDLAHGYRARSFRKTGKQNGTVLSDQSVDFTTGKVSWLQDGVRHVQTFTFTSDTFVGPMLGVVLADVPERPLREAALHTIVFRPDPNVYMLRADVLQEEMFRVGTLAEPTTKVRLKADLGPVQNVVFASFIPTHYFWFTREEPPEFFAFEGSLGYGGPELRMVPERALASTAKADRTALVPR